MVWMTRDKPAFARTDTLAVQSSSMPRLPALLAVFRSSITPAAGAPRTARSKTLVIWRLGVSSDDDGTSRETTLHRDASVYYPVREGSGRTSQRATFGRQNHRS